MNLNKLCYKIFHIPGYYDPGNVRGKLFNELDSYLESKIARLGTPTILISNQEQYDAFCLAHHQLNPKNKFKWGELGIWASNTLAMKNFLDTDYEYLMLMEDDIYVKNKDRFLELLSEYMDQLPEDWEVFSYFVPEDQYTKYYLKEAKSFAEGFGFETAVTYRGIEENIQGGYLSYPRKDHKGVVESYQDWSMLCYIINRKTAEKILKDVIENGIYEPIDWYVFNVIYLDNRIPIEKSTLQKYGEYGVIAYTLQQQGKRGDIAYMGGTIKINRFKTYSITPEAEKGCSLFETASTYQLREVEDIIE